MRLVPKYTLLILFFTIASCAQHSWGKFYEIEQKKTSGGIAATAQITRIYLFPSTSQIDGNLGGRSGVDATCLTTRNASTFAEDICTNVRALISITVADQIINLPANYGLPTNLPILSHTEAQVGTNFADLTDGSLSLPLAAVGFTGVTNGWWSFSGTGTADGTLDAGATCNGGLANVGFNGTNGDSSQAGFQWMASAQNPCANTRHLLCLCF